MLDDTDPIACNRYRIAYAEALHYKGDVEAATSLPSMNNFK